MSFLCFFVVWYVLIRYDIILILQRYMFSVDRQWIENGFNTTLTYLSLPYRASGGLRQQLPAGRPLFIGWTAVIHWLNRLDSLAEPPRFIGWIALIHWLNRLDSLAESLWLVGWPCRSGLCIILPQCQHNDFSRLLFGSFEVKMYLCSQKGNSDEWRIWQCRETGAAQTG